MCLPKGDDSSKTGGWILSRNGRSCPFGSKCRNGFAVRTVEFITLFFFYKQLVYKQLAIILKIAKQLWGAQTSGNKQQHKITDYRKDYRLRSNLHCWTKATKQSKSLLFSRNFFGQSEKLMIWLTKKSWENTRKMFIRPHY